MTVEGSGIAGGFLLQESIERQNPTTTQDEVNMPVNVKASYAQDRQAQEVDDGNGVEDETNERKLFKKMQQSAIGVGTQKESMIEFQHSKMEPRAMTSLDEDIRNERH